MAHIFSCCCLLSTCALHSRAPLGVACGWLRVGGGGARGAGSSHAHCARQRANEDCTSYARRVCLEAQASHEAQHGVSCSLSHCEEETKLRCPFRELVRARANLAIEKVAKEHDLWEEAKATKACNDWYSGEISNLTRIAAVWDALAMLPCYVNEDNARSSSCFALQTDSISATHPLAKWCYRSKPIDLNIGFELSVQCCYSEDLQLLTVGHKGAGSVDFVTTVGSDGALQVAQHFQMDVLPYLACCALSDNCNKYSAVRPASLEYETRANVTIACNTMSTLYKWAPYHKYPPPYHPMSDLYKEWSQLHLNVDTPIPGPKLHEVLAISKGVVELISQGKNPYESPKTASPGKSTTKAPAAATQEPVYTTRDYDDATHAPTHATVDDETHAPAKTTSVDDETHAPSKATIADDETTAPSSAAPTSATLGDKTPSPSSHVGERGHAASRDDAHKEIDDVLEQAAKGFLKANTVGAHTTAPQHKSAGDRNERDDREE